MNASHPVVGARTMPAAAITSCNGLLSLSIDRAWTTLIVITTVYFLLHLYRRYSRDGRLPPSPPGLPILGHMHIFPGATERYKTFARWSKQYGPLISLKLGSMNFMVLGGDGMVLSELAEKRGAVYSGRPDRQLDRSLDRGESVLMEHNHAKWRVNRKLLAQQFPSMTSTTTVTEHVPIIEAESTQLLHELLHLPKGFEGHTVRFSSSIMTSIIYGIRGPTYDHPSVTGIANIMMQAGDLHGRLLPLDAFPFLKYLPEFLYPWRNKLGPVSRLRAELYKSMADAAKRRVEQGLNPESFATRVCNYANKVKSDKEAPEEMRMAESRIYRLLALAHEMNIVAINILTCIMALVNWPNVLQKARAEIDAVCDEETLPRFCDWARLRYVRMVVKESFRWRPPFPWGVQHSLEQDDSWNGYHLPKDSTLMLNIWDVHMTPSRYPNPDEFRPERFESFPLSSSEYLHKHGAARDHFSFGAGRRACPGSVIAEVDLFVSIARIIWAFDLSMPDGRPLDVAPETAFVGSNIRRPRPFKVDFKIRSSARASTIEREMQAAKENVFSRFG